MSSNQYISLALCFVLAVVTVTACFSRQYSVNHRLDILQPGGLVAVFVASNVLLPAAYLAFANDYVPLVASLPPDPDLFHATLALYILAMLAFGTGYRIRLIASRPRDRRAPPPLSAAVVQALLAAGILFKLIAFLWLGDFETVISRLSPYWRGELAYRGVTLPVGLMMAGLVLDGAALLYLARRVQLGGSVWLPATGVVVATVLTYLLTGKRTGILMPALAIMCVAYYHSRHTRLTPVLMWMGIFVVATAIGLLARILLPGLTQGYMLSLTDFTGGKSLLQAYMETPELALFEVNMVAIARASDMIDRAGGLLSSVLYYNFAHFSAIVPRLVWPGKPEFSDMSHVAFELTTGLSGSAGFAIGVVGVWYVWVGVPGVALVMFCLGLLFRNVYIRAMPRQAGPVGLMYYAAWLTIFFHLIRFGTLGFTFLTFLHFHAVAVLTVALGVMVSRRLQEGRRIVSSGGIGETRMRETASRGGGVLAQSEGGDGGDAHRAFQGSALLR